MKTVWIAVLSAALLGCSSLSLTPERVNVIAGIAGQAAAVGAADWLAKHPGHRDAFQSVINALSAVHKNGNTNNQALEDSFVEQMSSLPTDSLKGPDGELYVVGEPKERKVTNPTAERPYGGLVVWDAHLKKAVVVRGAATRPVLKATLIGLKRAMVPQPPAPVVARARKPGDLEGRTPEAGTGTLAGRSDLKFLAATNNAVASTFDVTLNEHGIQQVNVRWLMDPNASYTVQRREDKDWEGFASATNTNAVSTTCLWRTSWHHSCPVGLWRVVRR